MKKECLIVTAIGNDGSEERKLADRHYEIFKKAAEIAGVTAIRADKLSSDEIKTALWGKLRDSYIVIADLSIPNPNAAYELGIRHGMQMPVLIVTNDYETLPFDFQDLRAHKLRYDDSDILEIAKRLRTPVNEIQSTVFKDWQFRIVPPSFIEDKNVNFYDTYMDALRNAKEGVLMVGSGFDNNSSMASTFMRVLSGCAMRINMTRIEMAGKEKIKWWRMLARYLLPMQNFSLFVPRNPDDVILKDLALIDWRDEQKALVELMFHTKREIDPYEITSKDARRAGFAFFAHSSQLAIDLHNIIQDLKTRDKLIELKSVEQIAEHFEFGEDWDLESTSKEPQLYFAYGSNMKSSQMKDRASSFKYIDNAVLMDYDLVFGIPGTIFSGAVANIKNMPGSSVYGVLFEVDEITIDKMDFFEGVEQGEYARERATVVLCKSKEPVEAWVYSSRVKSVVVEKPSKIYLSRIIEGATEKKLPDKYIEKLTRFDTV